MPRSDRELLAETARCVAWAEPLGGLGSLAGSHDITGASSPGLLRRVFPQLPLPPRRPARLESDALIYADAERLAASIGRIAHPRLQVRWAGGNTRTSQPGQVVLDARLLVPRRGWDLPHRVDALMGMTLRDAAYAVRTPATFRTELIDRARVAGILDQPPLETQRLPVPVSQATFGRVRVGTPGPATPAPPASLPGAEPLIAIFLLVEAHHIDTWLGDQFPGFRRYLDTVWTWWIPQSEVERRIQSLRGNVTFRAVTEASITLLANRASGAMIPPKARPLLETMEAAIRQIGPDDPPERRYAMAISLYRMLRDLFKPEESQPQPAPGGPGTQPNEGDPDHPPIEPPDEQPHLANDDLEGRMAALEAMTAIADNGLDPGAVRDGLDPEQMTVVDGLNSGAGHRRAAGTGGDDDDETPDYVTHRHVRFPGVRPMKLITPPIIASARMRYDAAFTRMRPQIDALRQVLKFRLADRRHAIRAQTSGQIDEQALYRVAANDAQIFMRRSIESAPDQDLCILLDESASMGRGQQHVRATVVLFHHALKDMPGVHHWVFGFSGYGSGIALYRYLSPNRADLLQPERLGAISSREATPLAEAVAGAAEAMLSEGHARQRLMIVVTDGHPDDADGARRALRAAESRGVSIIGLGIAADAKAAGALFSHFTLYEDLTTLPRKVGAILRKVIGTTQ